MQLHYFAAKFTASCQYLLAGMLLLCIVNPALSQTATPINAAISIVLPYSPYLSDYTSPTSEKLILSLLLNDLNEPFYKVRLVFTIEGAGIRIQTKPDYRPASINLQSGFQERITADEIAPYFQTSNLVFEGITRQQYEKNAALPEGIYKFSVQVFDANRNIALSNKASASAWMMLNDPPFLISPLCDSKVKVIYPQNIIFQWQLRNASPNSFGNTTYHFRLVQVLPENNNPNQAINSMPPIFEATTEETSLYYGLTETQLVAGQQYAWRIEAKDKGGKDMFKNSGFSQVCTFTYGDKCKAPENIKLEVETAQRVRIAWESLPIATKYQVKYRVKGFDSASEWYYAESNTNSTVITDLKAGSKYEYQVESFCQGGSELSATDTFSTFALLKNRECGKPIVSTPIDITTQLSQLRANDVLNVDGFNVRVLEATGSNGTFTGRGVAYIPFLNAYVNTTFTAIGVNAQYQVTKGKIIADKVKTIPKNYQLVAKNSPIDICLPEAETPLSNTNKPITKTTPTDGKPNAATGSNAATNSKDSVVTSKKPGNTAAGDTTKAVDGKTAAKSIASDGKGVGGSGAGGAGALEKGDTKEDTLGMGDRYIFIKQLNLLKDSTQLEMEKISSKYSKSCETRDRLIAKFNDEEFRAIDYIAELNEPQGEDDWTSTDTKITMEDDYIVIQTKFEGYVRPPDNDPVMITAILYEQYWKSKDFFTKIIDLSNDYALLDNIIVGIINKNKDIQTYLNSKGLNDDKIAKKIKNLLKNEVQKL